MTLTNVILYLWKFAPSSLRCATIERHVAKRGANLADSRGFNARSSVQLQLPRFCASSNVPLCNKLQLCAPAAADHARFFAFVCDQRTALLDTTTAYCITFSIERMTLKHQTTHPTCSCIDELLVSMNPSLDSSPDSREKQSDVAMQQFALLHKERRNQKAGHRLQPIGWL